MLKSKASHQRWVINHPARASVGIGSVSSRDIWVRDGGSFYVARNGRFRRFTLPFGGGEAISSIPPAFADICMA